MAHAVATRRSASAGCVRSRTRRAAPPPTRGRPTGPADTRRRRRWWSASSPTCTSALAAMKRSSIASPPAPPKAALRAWRARVEHRDRRVLVDQQRDLRSSAERPASPGRARRPGPMTGAPSTTPCVAPRSMNTLRKRVRRLVQHLGGEAANRQHRTHAPASARKSRVLTLQPLGAGGPRTVAPTSRGCGLADQRTVEPAQVVGRRCARQLNRDVETRCTGNRPVATRRVSAGQTRSVYQRPSGTAPTPRRTASFGQGRGPLPEKRRRCAVEGAERHGGPRGHERSVRPSLGGENAAQPVHALQRHAAAAHHAGQRVLRPPAPAARFLRPAGGRGRAAARRRR